MLATKKKKKKNYARKTGAWIVFARTLFIFFFSFFSFLPSLITWKINFLIVKAGKIYRLIRPLPHTYENNLLLEKNFSDTVEKNNFFFVPQIKNERKTIS